MLCWAAPLDFHTHRLPPACVAMMMMMMMPPDVKPIPRRTSDGALQGVMPARRLAGADLGSGVASNISVFSSSAPGEAGSNGNAGGHAHGSSAAGAGSGMLQGLAGLQGLARQLLDGMEGDMSGSGVGGRR